jgi:hypothetical protein
MRRCSARLERLKGANVERAQFLPEQRHAVKEYFPHGGNAIQLYYHSSFLALGM